MFSLLRRLISRETPARVSQTSGRVVLRLEALEDRLTPSLYNGFTHLNTTTNQAQFDVQSAANKNGTRVDVWVQSTANGFDVKAQRFSRLGARIGSEITVASTVANEFDPDVAIDNAGGFYVSYTRRISDTNTDVLVARYSPTAVRLGVTSVGFTAREESSSSIACSSTGNFVVAYEYSSTSTDSHVYMKLYTAAGALTGNYAVASTAAKEYDTEVAYVQNDAARADFAVTYVRANNIYVNRYGFNSAGQMVSRNLGLAVAATAYTEVSPSISANRYGNFVVAYERNVAGDLDIAARRINSNGSMSTTFIVQARDSAADINPTVALKDDGDFVVAYHSESTSTGGTIDWVSATEMNATGTARATYTVQSDPGQNLISVNIDPLGYYQVTYSLIDAAGDPGYGVFARRGLLT